MAASGRDAATAGIAPVDSTDDGRDESAADRLDRNWNELLQELRVMQTGVQILSGFLLTVPFQQRFTWTVSGAFFAATVTGWFLAPLASARGRPRRSGPR